jgi:glycosyltransferase involved in cell wall biosynthesis
MKITVAIAAYNSESTIRATLDSVFRQTVPADEVLVVNDGSTDQTASILNSYKPRVTVLGQENKGLSASRNVLCKHAAGDLIAFLDADDIWHPQYIEVQRNLFSSNPNAVAFFTGHVNFRGDERPLWDAALLVSSAVEVIEPAEFFTRYAKATGPFASPSYCCVPKSVLRMIGEEPFDESLRVCDDAYLFYLLALRGPIVYAPVPAAAYRLTPGSLSSNRLRNLESGVRVFELLSDRYQEMARTRLYNAFQMAFAAKRREYAKVLMGAGKMADAQHQLWSSLADTRSPGSVVKSLGLLVLSYMPPKLQLAWPSVTIR